MKRLIQRGLMFGNLIRVDSPVLIERYNRALLHLTGKTTALSDFHIDISGFSPEVGDDLGDALYLNHGGVNRQFILLTTEQKRAPLLDAKFSTSRTILRDFITENETQLFALTATDAVAGELVNSVFEVTTPERLFDIRQVKIEADTTGGTLKHAQALGDLVERFKNEEDGWIDEALIAGMIDLAGKTGDLTRNPVKLRFDTHKQRNFWTAHFGGLYLFQGVAHPAVIAAGKPPRANWPLEHVYDLSQRAEIAAFLEKNKLVEPIVTRRSRDAAAVLQQKMDFIVVQAAAQAGLDLSDLDRGDMRRLARSQAAMLPQAYHGLARLVAWVQTGGSRPSLGTEHPAYFYALRAADTPDKDLVNMLLAELTRMDFRAMFICHKDLFYREYRSWPEAQKAYVVQFLDREYQIDKAGAREALYGHEPDMSGDARKDLIARVGPWGAVRGRR